MSDADREDKEQLEDEVSSTADYSEPPLQPGSLIGRFRIERELGRGGMGVVYLARDAKLDRLVAIKSLPAALTHRPDALARFRREARILASLNRDNLRANRTPGPELPCARTHRR